MSTIVNAQKGKRFDLSKRIPENPRYKNVKATVDTGASLTRYMQKIDEIRQNYKFRKNEIFKRMKLTTFVQLLIQIQRLSRPDDAELPSTPANGDRPDTADREVQDIERGGGTPHSLALTDGDYGMRTPDTQRSTLLSVARGVGEMDLNAAPRPPQNSFVDDSLPYLLLDLRDRDEYELCHIISAYSYPRANLSRATNYETKEMFHYRNKEGKIVVIYDEDERFAPEVATTLVQRGYDNLFMLSGGLKLAAKLIPQGMITGTLPPSITGVKPKEFMPALQKSYTTEDIDTMEMYLDSALEDKSIASRLSKNSSRASDASRLTNRSTNDGRPPFK